MLSNNGLCLHTAAHIVTIFSNGWIIWLVSNLWSYTLLLYPPILMHSCLCHSFCHQACPQTHTRVHERALRYYHPAIMKPWLLSKVTECEHFKLFSSAGVCDGEPAGCDFLASIGECGNPIASLCCLSCPQPTLATTPVVIEPSPSPTPAPTV